MNNKQILEALELVRKESKKRNFNQSIDLSISLRDVNLKDPNKRFRAEVLLPHVINDSIKICVIGDADVIARAKAASIFVTLDEVEVENFGKNLKGLKAFVEEIDYFLAIPQMMAAVGRFLGRVLGPAGKMPTILPPNADLSNFITRYSRTCRIRLRQNPVIHCKVASEDMENNAIVENVRTVLNEIENRLDQGAQNIRKAHIKTTMGPAVIIGA